LIDTAQKGKAINKVSAAPYQPKVPNVSIED